MSANNVPCCEPNSLDMAITKQGLYFKLTRCLTAQLTSLDCSALKFKGGELVQEGGGAFMAVHIIFYY